jgi:hypothetical protein
MAARRVVPKKRRKPTPAVELERRATRRALSNELGLQVLDREYRGRLIWLPDYRLPQLRLEKR